MSTERNEGPKENREPEIIDADSSGNGSSVREQLLKDAQYLELASEETISALSNLLPLLKTDKDRELAQKLIENIGAINGKWHQFLETERQSPASKTEEEYIRLADESSQDKGKVEKVLTAAQLFSEQLRSGRNPQPEDMPWSEEAQNPRRDRSEDDMPGQPWTERLSDKMHRLSRNQVGVALLGVVLLGGMGLKSCFSGKATPEAHPDKTVQVTPPPTPAQAGNILPAPDQGNLFNAVKVIKRSNGGEMVSMPVAFIMDQADETMERTLKILGQHGRIEFLDNQDESTYAYNPEWDTQTAIFLPAPLLQSKDTRDIIIKRVFATIREHMEKQAATNKSAGIQTPPGAAYRVFRTASGDNDEASNQIEILFDLNPNVRKTKQDMTRIGVHNLPTKIVTDPAPALAQ